MLKRNVVDVFFFFLPCLKQWETNMFGHPRHARTKTQRDEEMKRETEGKGQDQGGRMS
jgi:hypothetical protein